MRRRITVLIVALMLALTMSFGSVAFAQGGGIQEKRTNPGGNETQGQGKAITVQNENPAGKAPAGQNK
jgi:hypothetical protein